MTPAYWIPALAGARMTAEEALHSRLERRQQKCGVILGHRPGIQKGGFERGGGGEIVPYSIR